MKTINILNYLGMLSVLTLATPSIAGVGSHGGGGVLENGKPYVLDLVEAGTEQNPYFDSSVTADPIFTSKVQKAFAGLPGTPTDLVARKLTELYRMDKTLAAYLAQVMEMYLWRGLDLSLLKIYDEDIVVNIDPSLQLQLAARFEHTVALDNSLWNQLDDANKAALIFHEVIYAAIAPEKVQLPGSNYSYFMQSSPHAREVTGFLFSSDSQLRGREGLTTLVDYSLPMLDGSTKCAWSSDQNLVCNPRFTWDDLWMLDDVKSFCENNTHHVGPCFSTIVVNQSKPYFSTYEGTDLKVHTCVANDLQEYATFAKSQPFDVESDVSICTDRATTAQKSLQSVMDQFN